MSALSELAAVLDTRASFMLSALIVAWIAIGLLVMMVANLNLRLRRLEGAAARPDVATGRLHAHLIGRRLSEILDTGTELTPRVLILLSNSCSSCTRLLQDLQREEWREPAAIGWIDHTPSPLPDVPSNATVVDGSRIGRDLGIRLTPFALVADESGRVVDAAAFNSLSKLGLTVGSTAT